MDALAHGAIVMWSAFMLEAAGMSPKMAEVCMAEIARRGEPSDSEVCSLAHGEIPPHWDVAKQFRPAGDADSDPRLHGTAGLETAGAGMVPVAPVSSPTENPTGKAPRRKRKATVPPVPPSPAPADTGTASGGLVPVSGRRSASGRIALPYLSYSRVDLAGQCPLAYWARYHEHTDSEPADALELGSVVHAVLEAVVQKHVAEELAAAIDVTAAVEVFRRSWSALHISDPIAYRDGEEMIQKWAAAEGILDGRNVLAVEREIDLTAGPYKVTGYLDRVDQVDDDTIEVIDYKTNRALYARHEVDDSLQLAIYDVAARKIWPWARNVRLSYRMLRHGCTQSTTGTPEQRAATLGYLEAMGNRLSACTEWPARLNEHCSWCDYRAQCGTYQDALTAPQGPLADLSDIQAVARERERVAASLSALNARKKDLDKALNAAIAEQGDVTVDDVTYCQYSTRSISYPLEPTIARLAHESGRSVVAVAQDIAEISNTRLNEMIANLRPKKAEAEMLRLELEAMADVTVSPRLWAKKNRRTGE